jgi:heme exporter protein C
VHKFANPTQFMRIANAIYPWAAGLCVILFLVGLPISLVTSPDDYQQGDTVRIFYVHMPAGTMFMMIYGVMAGGSAAYLIWRHPMANLVARASAPVGAVFSALSLGTGMLWGQPMWGTFWVWDARLTSTLITFFIYLGYIALSDAFEDPERGDRAAAILALVGVVNIPIIKFSVEWWNTLHQPATLGVSSFSIDAAMLLPLGLMFGAFLTFYISVLILRLRSELLAAKIRNARLSQVAGQHTAQPAE